MHFLKEVLGRLAFAAANWNVKWTLVKRSGFSITYSKHAAKKNQELHAPASAENMNKSIWTFITFELVLLMCLRWKNVFSYGFWKKTNRSMHTAIMHSELRRNMLSVSSTINTKGLTVSNFSVVYKLLLHQCFGCLLYILVILETIKHMSNEQINRTTATVYINKTNAMFSSIGGDCTFTHCNYNGLQHYCQFHIYIP